MATAAYNAGPGNVDKALQQSGAKDFWHIKTKTQLTEETHNFVPKFVAISLIAMDPSKYGLNDVRYEEALDYEEVELKAPRSSRRSRNQRKPISRIFAISIPRSCVI